MRLLLGGAMLLATASSLGPIHAGERTYNRDLFMFILTIILMAGLYSKEVDDKDVHLNRAQTEEWKGWMQVRCHRCELAVVVVFEPPAILTNREYSCAASLAFGNSGLWNAFV